MRRGGAFVPQRTIVEQLVDEPLAAQEMRLQFEAVSQLPDEDQKVVKAVLDGMIVKHQTKRMVGSLSS